MTNHEQHHTDERPAGLQIQISQAVVSNCRVGAKCTQADVLNDIQSFIGTRHYADMYCFPNEKSDLSPFSNSTWLNDYSINCHQLQNLTKRDKNLYSRLKRDNSLPRHIWCLWCDQLWMEFTGVVKAHDRPVTFMDAFPVRLWFCQEVMYGDGDEVDGSQASSSERTQSPSSCCSSIEMLEMAREVDEASLSPASSLTQSPAVSHRKPSAASIRSDSGLMVNANHAFSEQNTTILSRTTPIRPCNSDTNLSETRQQQLDQHDVSSCIRNGDWGGPPPPYDGNSVNMSTSLTSIPPAYEYSQSAEIPGPISKPPLNDISVVDNILTADIDQQERATMALLVNITKTVQIQLDHFQMISLIRTSEVLSNMMDRIKIDKANSEEERKMGVNMDSTSSLAKDREGVVLNLVIPHVVIDLIMAPCVGIDPIQKLSLNERLQYEKQVKESGVQVSCPVSSDVYRLPVRSKSRTPSGISSRSNSLTSTPTEQRKLSPREFSNTDPFVMSNSSSSAKSSQELLHSTSQQRLAVENTFKEVKDAQIQVGDSLMNANLKPSYENQLVSVLRIHSDRINVGVQANGDDLAVKLTSQGINLNELGNMKYGRILDPRGSIIEEKSEENKQNVNMNQLTGDAMLKLRLVFGPAAEHIAAGSKDLGFADIRVTSLAAALLQSTIDNLTEFSEDECVMPVMPFTVQVSCSDISIYDDKPRRSRSAIKQPPVRVIIDEITAQRNNAGVVIIKNKSNVEEPTTTETNVKPSLSDAEFHPNVNGVLVEDSIHEQVDLLIGENGRLVEDLKVMNAKVNGLHVERDSLLKVIEKLQRELLKSNCENDDLQTRVRSMSLSQHNNSYPKR